MLLLVSEVTVVIPSLLAERLSQRRLVRPEKMPGCRVEKWF